MNKVGTLFANLVLLTREVEGLSEARNALALVYTPETTKIKGLMAERLTKATKDLNDALSMYERTGDHDHSVTGSRPIPVGGACPGGDCMVDKARKVLLEVGAARCGFAEWLDINSTCGC